MNAVICHWLVCVVFLAGGQGAGSGIDVETCSLPVCMWPTTLWLTAAGTTSLWRSTAQPLDSPLMPATPTRWFCLNPAGSVSPVGLWCWPAPIPAQMQSAWASPAVWRRSVQWRGSERRGEGRRELARRPAGSSGSTSAARMWSCASNPCENGGTCVEEPSGGGKAMFFFFFFCRLIVLPTIS